MAVYRTTFSIAASADTVWDVLTDFERYPEWNPSVPLISGELRPGSIVSLTARDAGQALPKAEGDSRRRRAGAASDVARQRWGGLALRGHS